MRELLDLCADFPERVAEPGEVLLAEGPATDTLLVLVEGEVEVRTGEVVLARVEDPGACFGEIAALLGGPHTASVVAVSPCRLHVVADATRTLNQNAGLAVAVGRLLAVRLRLANAYLADLQRQYAGEPGNLSLVGQVLGALMRQEPGSPARPGSARDPDPLY
jgi:CRP-like cAMP-binding protein